MKNVENWVQLDIFILPCKRHQSGIIYAEVFKLFLEIDCYFILPISWNQLNFASVFAMKIESSLSEWDILEKIRVKQPSELLCGISGLLKNKEEIINGSNVKL